MDKQCSPIKRSLRRLLVLLAVLGSAGSVYAQSSTGITARMLFPPRNYEIPLGDTIVPTVRVINTGAVIDSGIKVWFRYSNVSWPNNTAVYSSKISVPNLAPGDSIDLSFAAYASNPNIISELGTFNGCLTILDTVPLTTTCSSMFAIRRTSVPFFDPSDGFSKAYVGNYNIPDQTMWVSVGATVVDGEDSTWDPPPPRYPGQGVGGDGMISPVIRLDRLDYNGNFYSGTGVGDTLTSFPINLQGKQEIFLSFDFMRAGRYHYPFGWDDSLMFGPETTITDSAGNVIRPGDSLILEFEKPSGPVTNPGQSYWNEIAAIDGGRDFEYKSFFMSPDSDGWQIRMNGITTFLKDTTNYFTANFRFRFRLKANNDASKSTSTVDDADQWYIDNVLLQWPFLPEVEMSWVRVVNPYSKVPLSQAIFPVFAKVFNTCVGNGYAPPFLIQIVDSSGDTVYAETAELADLYDGEDTILQFPDWDASGEQLMSGAAYTAIASSDPTFNGDNSLITQTYTKFFMNVDSSATGVQEFAMDDAGLDPAPGVGNDIPKLTGVPGSGMGFQNATGSIGMRFQLANRDSIRGVRIYFGSSNPSPDPIEIDVLASDENSNVPLVGGQEQVEGTLVTQRNVASLDQFQTYYFPKPITLPGGTHWIAVSQLSGNSMEVGGTVFRGGAYVRSNYGPVIAPVYGNAGDFEAPSLPWSWYGTQWGIGSSDNNGDIGSSFAVDSPAGYGWWTPWAQMYGAWPTMDSRDGLEPNIFSRLDTISWTGAGTYFPLIRPIIGGSPSSKVDESSAVTFNLQNIYPNPFDPTVSSSTISFSLDVQGATTLTICNILGDIVKTLVNAPMSAGSHSVLWDGRDEKGAFVSAGTYFISLTSDGRRANEKIIVTE